MLGYEDLPAQLRDPGACLVHLFSIEFHGAALPAAAAWFDTSDPYAKSARVCVFDVPGRIDGDIAIFQDLISGPLGQWVHLHVIHSARQYTPSIRISDHAFEKTGSDTGTLIFSSVSLYTAEKTPLLCGKLNAHDKLSMLSRSDILHIR